MIIYGSKATKLRSEVIPDKCPNCGSQGTVEISVYQKYAHLFWIPFFPIGKTGSTECSSCKQVIRKNEFPESFKQIYETLKSSSKAPVWIYSGLGLLVILIIFITINSNRKNEKNAALIVAPQKGDVYEIKKDYKQYTLYKVEEVIGDTVYILMNEYETNKISGLNDIRAKGDEAYDDVLEPILKRDLKALLDKGEIIDIERK